MSEILYTEAAAEQLAGKVVVLTGGAQGIGAATVKHLCSLGAHVFFGDADKHKGEAVCTAVSDANVPGTAKFQYVDVRWYCALFGLFEAAFKKHGRVDVAVSCAAVPEPKGDWFGPEGLDLDSARRDPGLIQDAVQINLTSVLLFSRLALAHFKASPPSADKGSGHALVLVSSIAGITPAPGLPVYSATKHGVVGLARSLATWAPATFPELHIRVNALCPWATDTQLLAPAVRAAWVAQDMPLNSALDVARVVVQCAGDAALSGRTVFVSGGRAFDVEEGMMGTTGPAWMGEENWAVFMKGQEILGNGEGWSASGADGDKPAAATPSQDVGSSSVVGSSDRAE